MTNPFDDESNRAIGLVLNRLEVQIATPIEIVTGCTLRRPTEGELAFIKAVLDRTHLLPLLCRSFETDPPPETGSYITLDPANWRYWVVEVTNTTAVMAYEPLYRLTMASMICDVAIPCDAISFLTDGITGLDLGCHRLVLPGHLSGPPKVVNASVLEQIRWVHARLADIIATGHPMPVYSAVEHYASLANNLLAPPHPLFVFAIIESILTHDPEDGYDSLTHQVPNKMILLNKRFDRPLDYSVFGSPGEATVWKKLYSYRSALAHGGTPDFTGKLSVLKNQSIANQFIMQAARSLLRQTLKEPELIFDLQRC